jgi:hypothetical protein
MTGTDSRVTWVDGAGTTWRIELVDSAWRVSRWSTASETWLLIGSYASKSAAIDSAWQRSDR